MENTNMSGDLKETHQGLFFPWIWANRGSHLLVLKWIQRQNPRADRSGLLSALLLCQRAMDSVEVTGQYLKFYPSDGQPVKTKGFSQVYRHKHEMESTELEDIFPGLPWFRLSVLARLCDAQEFPAHTPGIAHIVWDIETTEILCTRGWTARQFGTGRTSGSSSQVTLRVAEKVLPTLSTHGAVFTPRVCHPARSPTPAAPTPHVHRQTSSAWAPENEKSKLMSWNSERKTGFKRVL